MKFVFAVTALAMGAVAVPAVAATNLIVNGSFETGNFTGFTYSVNGVTNPTSMTGALANPAVVITYNSNAGGYGGGGAYGELIPVDNAVSVDPDGAGSRAAYFVDDFAKNEAISQLTALNPGNYEIGFDVYLPHNGANNPVNASINGSIIGVNVANLVASQVGAAQWYNISGVATILVPGYYQTAFTYNSNGYPAKDFVIDKVYVTSTNKTATYTIPATPTAPLPEPATWSLMLVGFVMVGASMRRRSPKAVAA